MLGVDISLNVERLRADEVIDRVLTAEEGLRACFTCSFQAEDIAVLHLLRQRRPEIPVVFLETGYHFSETYQFRDELTRDWNLNLVNALPKKSVPEQESEFGVLYRDDPTKCCQLRKVAPLMETLQAFEIWFTGLRREQSPTRKNLQKLEQHRLPSGKSLLKVSPLADWTWAQVWSYMGQHRLKYLPQYDHGYTSIGCQPCTAIPTDPDNSRSGRWNGKKLECGIHTFSEQSQ